MSTESESDREVCRKSKKRRLKFVNECKDEAAMFSDNHFESLFDSQNNDRRITIATNHLALGQWELARSLILSIFRCPLESEPDARLSVDSDGSITFQQSSKSICARCQCLNLLRSIALVGPPSYWFCSPSVPSSSHLSLFCLNLFDHLVHDILNTLPSNASRKTGRVERPSHHDEDARADSSERVHESLHNISQGVNSALHIENSALRNVFSLFSVPIWCRCRLVFDVLLAQLLFDSSESRISLKTNPFSPKSGTELRLLFCGLLGIGVLRGCPPLLYESVRKNHTATAHINPRLGKIDKKIQQQNVEVEDAKVSAVTLTPDVNENSIADSFNNNNIFIRCPNSDVLTETFPISPGIGFVPSLSLLPAAYPTLPPTLSRLPSKVITISNLPFLPKQHHSDAPVGNRKQLEIKREILSPSCEMEIMELLSSRPMLTYCLVSVLKMVTLFALAKTSASELFSMLSSFNGDGLPTFRPNNHRAMYSSFGSQHMPIARLLTEIIGVDQTEELIATKTLFSLMHQLSRMQVAVASREIKLCPAPQPTAWFAVGNALWDYWTVMKMNVEYQITSGIEEAGGDQEAKKKSLKKILCVTIKSYFSQLSKTKVLNDPPFDVDMACREQDSSNVESVPLMSGAAAFKGGMSAFAQLARKKTTWGKGDGKEMKEKKFGIPTSADLKYSVVDPSIQFLHISSAAFISAIDGEVSPAVLLKSLSNCSTSQQGSEPGSDDFQQIVATYLDHLFNTIGSSYFNYNYIQDADEFSKEVIQLLWGTLLNSTRARINPQHTSLDQATTPTSNRGYVPEGETIVQQLKDGQSSTLIERHRETSLILAMSENVSEALSLEKESAYYSPRVRQSSDEESISGLEAEYLSDNEQDKQEQDEKNEQDKQEQDEKNEQDKQEQDEKNEQNPHRVMGSIPCNQSYNAYEFWERFLGYSTHPSSLNHTHGLDIENPPADINLFDYVREVQNEWRRIRGTRMPFAELFRISNILFSKTGWLRDESEGVPPSCDCVYAAALDEFWSVQTLLRPAEHWISTILEASISLWSAPVGSILSSKQGTSSIGFKESKMRVEILQKLLGPFPQLIPLVILMGWSLSSQMDDRLLFRQLGTLRLWRMYSRATKTQIGADILLEEAVERIIAICSTARSIAKIATKILSTENQSITGSNNDSSLTVLHRKKISSTRLCGFLAARLQDRPLLCALMELPSSVLSVISPNELLSSFSIDPLTTREADAYIVQRNKEVAIAFFTLRDLCKVLETIVFTHKRLILTQAEALDPNRTNIFSNHKEGKLLNEYKIAWSICLFDISESLVSSEFQCSLKSLSEVLNKSSDYLNNIQSPIILSILLSRILGLLVLTLSSFESSFSYISEQPDVMFVVPPSAAFSLLNFVKLWTDKLMERQQNNDSSSPNIAFMKRLHDITMTWQERAELTIREMEELQNRLSITIEADIPRLKSSISRFAPPYWSIYYPPPHFISRSLVPPSGIFARALRLDDINSARLAMTQRKNDVMKLLMSIVLEQHQFYSTISLHKKSDTTSLVSLFREHFRQHLCNLKDILHEGAVSNTNCLTNLFFLLKIGLLIDVGVSGKMTSEQRRQIFNIVIHKLTTDVSSVPSNLKAHILSFLERLNVVLIAATRVTYSIMDPLISVDLLSGSISTASSQAATLKSHLDRLQESRRAVDVFSGLLDTLEGRSLHPLNAESVLNQLRAIMAMLMPNQCEEASYFSKFVGYLICLVQWISDASQHTGQEYDVKILCRSPKDWICCLLFLYNGWQQAKEYADAVGFDFFEILITSTKPSIPLEHNLTDQATTINFNEYHNRKKIPSLEFLEYMATIEKEERRFPIGSFEQDEIPSFMTLLAHLERDCQIPLFERLSVAEKQSKRFPIIQRWIKSFIEVEKWHISPPFQQFPERSDDHQISILTSESKQEQRIIQPYNAEKYIPMELRDSKFGKEDELRANFVNSERVRKLLRSYDVSGTHSASVLRNQMNDSTLQWGDQSQLLSCLEQWLKDETTFASPFLGATDTSSARCSEKAVLSFRLPLLLKFIQLEEGVRFQFLRLVGESHEINQNLLCELILLHYQLVKFREFIPSAEDLILGKLFLALQLQRDVNSKLEELILAAVEENKFQILQEYNSLIPYKQCIDSFRSLIMSLIPSYMNHNWADSRPFHLLRYMFSMDSSIASNSWFCLAHFLVTRMIELLSIQCPLRNVAIDWGLHPCLRSTTEQFEEETKQNEIFREWRMQHKLLPHFTPPLIFVEACLRYVLSLSAECGQVLKKPNNYIKNLRLIGLLAIELLDPIPLKILPEQLWNNTSISFLTDPCSLPIKDALNAIILSELESGNMKRAKLIHHTSNFILSMESSPELPNTTKMLKKIIRTRNERWVSVHRKGLVSGNPTVASRNQVSSTTMPKEDESTLIRKDDEDLPFCRISEKLIAHMARVGQLNEASQMLKHPSGVYTNEKRNRKERPVLMREIFRLSNVECSEFHKKSHQVTASYAPNQFCAVAFNKNGIASMNSTFYHLGIHIQNDATEGLNSCDRSDNLNVAESIESTGCLPNVDRLVKFMEWSTVERLKRSHEHVVQRPFLLTDENLHYSEEFLNGIRLSRLISKIKKDEKKDETFVTSTEHTIYPETPEEAWKLLVCSQPQEGKQRRNERLPTMMEVVDILKGDLPQKLTLLIQRYRYRQALEMSLTAPSVRGVPPLCEVSTLTELASRGDLVRPFSMEILQLLSERKRFSEVATLKNQLDAIGEFLISRRMLTSQLDFFSMRGEHLQAAAVAVELSVTTDCWDARISLLRRACIDHFAALSVLERPRSLMAPSSFHTFDRLSPTSATQLVSSTSRHDSSTLPVVHRSSHVVSQQSETSESSKDFSLDASPPLLDLDPGALWTSVVLFNIVPCTHHRRLISQATPLQIHRASALAQLELDILEELPHLPKHYTLLLPGLSSLRIKIAEHLLSKGSLHLADTVIYRFRLPFIDIGVNSLLEAVRFYDELQKKGNVGTIDQFLRFKSIAQFLRKKMTNEAFSLVVKTLTDLWEEQLKDDGEENGEMIRRVGFLKSLVG